ncbi:MAG: BrnT family toxin [Oscillospiraceae bacterium]|nr:BrnT family toxin [Oscillospiraceae bacterium]
MQDDNFIWNENKNQFNIRKHGVSFQEARDVFFDENAIYDVDIEHSFDEERFIIIGMSESSKLLFVCYCERGEDSELIRIISARKADKTETDLYWEEYDNEL